MKTKFKNAFKVMVLFSFTVLSSCEKDLYNETTHGKKSKVTVKKVSLKELYKTKENPNLLKAVDIIKAKNETILTNNKMVYNEKYGFYFDDEKGKLVETDGAISYTFQIFRDEASTKTENIVFVRNNQNEYDAYLSKYQLTSEQKEKLLNDEQINMSNVPIEISSITGKCDYWAVDSIDYENSVVYWVFIPCEGGGGDSSTEPNTPTQPNTPIEPSPAIDPFPTNPSPSTPNGGSVGGSSSGGGGSSSVNSVVTSPVVSTSPVHGGNKSLIEKLYPLIDFTLTSEQNTFLLNPANYGFLNSIITFLEISEADDAQNFIHQLIDNLIQSQANLNLTNEFVNWAVGYLITNPNTSWEQFQNQFMGTSEGTDGTYDAAYWDNSNLTFPPQNLPSFNDFKNACPSKYDNAGTVCNNIGGDILTMYNDVIASGKKLNTCAIRISRALNYSGIIIPSLPNNPNGSKNTVTGADGKNYIINAKTLNAWMRKTFGTNTSNYLHFTSAQGGVKGAGFQQLLSNINGIYSMVALPSIQSTWGFGHADLLENGGCLLSCHFYDVNNNFVPISYIDVWILN